MAARAPRPDGIQALLGLLFEQVSELARLYAAAARQEVEDSLNHLKVGVILLAVAFSLLAVAGMVLVILAVTAISRATGLELWATALIVFVIIMLLAGLIAWLAYRRLRQAKVIPEETIAAAKEDLEWAQHWTKRG